MKWSQKKYCDKLKCNKFVTAVLSTGSLLLLLSGWQSVRDRGFETMKHTFSFRVETHIWIFGKILCNKSHFLNHKWSWKLDLLLGDLKLNPMIELKTRSLIEECLIKSNKTKGKLSKSLVGLIASRIRFWIGFWDQISALFRIRSQIGSWIRFRIGFRIRSQILVRLGG